MKKDEKSFRYLWANIKHTNIYVIRVPEEQEKGAEKIFGEILAPNPPV